MADFLPMLRAANIFPRNRATDRPFGMPEIDTSSGRQVLGQASRIANFMKNKDLQRQKELMQFQHDLTRPIVQENTPMRSPKNVVVKEGGFSPMQQQFQEETRQGKENAFRSREAMAERSGRLQQALTEGSQRSEAEMARLMADINARKEIAQMSHGSAQTIADKQLESRKAEIEARRLEEESRRRFQSGESTRSREFTAGENEKNRAATAQNTIRQIQGRPEVAAAQKVEQNRRIQSFLISNPEFKNKIEFDTDSDMWVPRGDLSPQELETLRGVFGGKQSSSSVNSDKSTGFPPKGTTQRKDGKTRISDGTKWVYQ